MKKNAISTVGLATLGCKVNQCDSAALAGLLAAAGFTLVPFSGPADAYIINTCTVTAFADFQARQLIRRAHRANPRARILVTGCYAQTQAETLAALDHVSYVIGNDSKHHLPELLCAPVRTQGQKQVGDIFSVRQFFAAPAAGPANRTRAFFKIQAGCDAFCSYCIVPFARGKSRSLPLADFLSGVRELAARGYREIVLTGIHLGFYGQDLEPPVDLSRALAAVLAQHPQTRFRLSSIEPNEVTDALLELFVRHENLCPHLHLPLQSGDDGVLRQMKRRYDAAFYRALVARVVQTVPDMAVGVDVMVGFPGESEEAFAHTLALIKELPLAYLHVFPYSERPGTAALAIEPKVLPPVKKERAAVLRLLGAQKREAFARRFLGRTLPVLVEQTRDKKTGLARGFSHNYLPVVLDKLPGSLVNSICTVNIESYRDNKLTGRVIDG